MKIKLILLSFIVLIFFVFCSKENETKVSMIKYINAEGGLKMRELPDANSKVVILIPNASEVSVIKETGSEIEISGKKGKWTEVSYTDKTGWVFGGFLSETKNIPRPLGEYSIKFQNQESEMFNLVLNPDGTFSGRCYNGSSSEANWKGRYKKIDDETFHLTGNASYYGVGPEGEIKQNFDINTDVVIRNKDGKYQVYHIYDVSLPGCSEISITEGVLKNTAYGNYNYWDDL